MVDTVREHGPAPEDRESRLNGCRVNEFWFVYPVGVSLPFQLTLALSQEVTVPIGGIPIGQRNGKAARDGRRHHWCDILATGAATNMLKHRIWTITTTSDLKRGPIEPTLVELGHLAMEWIATNMPQR